MASNPNNVDLDLTGVNDPDEAARKVELFYRQDSNVKSQLSWGWERNHLMLDGKQWIVFNGEAATGGTWNTIKVSKQNEYIPRPVTNYIFDIYQTLKSYLIKNKPRSTVHPNTMQYRDKQSAKIATMVLDCNWERLKEQYNYEYAASTLVVYGTVFKKSFWDTSTTNMVKVPRMDIVPRTDPMTGQIVGMDEVPATDPNTGEQLFDLVPLGDVGTDVIEPYRITIDPLAMDLHKARWIMEYSIQPISWIQEVYGKDPEQFPGYTGRVEEVKEEGSLSASMDRFYKLKSSSGVKNAMGASGSTTGGTNELPSNTAVVKEYYERPSLKYPKGRLIVVANKIPLYVGESPCEGPELGDWHPYSECRWELVPGRFWGKSPIDNAVELQKQVNSIDSVISLTRKTMAIPQKLIPMGSGIDPGQWTGRSGQEIFYRETGTGAVPQTIPGVGVDGSVFQERAQKVQDIQNVTGAIDILKGDRPPGVNAASALNLLYEVGTGKLFPILDRWKMFVEQDQKKQLRLVAKNFKEPRPDFIQMLRSRNTELTEEAISKFIGTDLYDNCNVVIEAGSNIPKLQSAKQALLMEMAQTGSLNLDLPANRMEFQRQMGVSGFDNDVGPDMKRAEWENDLLDNLVYSPDNVPVVIDADMDDIHIAVHDKRMKEPSFMSLPFEIQQAYLQHKQQHEQAKMMKQQAQMMEQMAMQGGAPQPGGMPGGAPGQAGPGPTNMQPAGNGITKEQKNALSSDMLTPANLGRR
jgi:hypothetical protein